MILWEKTYALIKSLNNFRVYIMHSHILCYVPNNVVNNILTRPDPEGKRAKWIAILLEYYVEIKPRKLIKDKGWINQ